MKKLVLTATAIGLAVIMTAPPTMGQSTSCSIKGVVRYPSRKPAASVWVIVSQNRVEKRRSLTQDDGGYFIGNLAQGKYDLVVLKGRSTLYRRSLDLSVSKAYVYEITAAYGPAARR